MPADTVSLSAIAAQQHVPKAEPNTVLPHSAGQAGGEAGSSAHPGTEAPTASLPFSPGSCQGPLRPTLPHPVPGPGLAFPSVRGTDSISQRWVKGWFSFYRTWGQNLLSTNAAAPGSPPAVKEDEHISASSSAPPQTGAAAAKPPTPSPGSGSLGLVSQATPLIESLQMSLAEGRLGPSVFGPTGL